ncbi:MAG: hypothetical protein ABIQ89_03270 [Candidatus Saccharimonadales bacterium]
MSLETKTAPYSISEQLLLAQESVIQPPVAEYISVEEAAALDTPNQLSVQTTNGRFAPRMSELRANVAGPQYTDTQELSPVVAEQPVIMPIEVTKVSLASRLKTKFSRARQNLQTIFHKEEAPTNVEKFGRRRAIAGLAGTIAVGLVMSVAPSTSPSTNVVEQHPMTSVTAVAEAVKAPAHHNSMNSSVGQATGQEFSKRDEVSRYIVAHPEASQRLLTWISTSKAQNPAISDAHMQDQFNHYFNIDS